ncbi:MAG: hycD [Myxococcales bacterium]|nr:hycD [Myxococcales bacterium]
MLRVVANLAALVVMPIVLAGVINRVKSLWAGRRGPPILQLAYDLRRLVRKTPVYSAVTTPVFRIGPAIVLAMAVVSALIVPLVGARPIASFDFDFVWFAYVWGFGRIALMLGALDTGSSFEGMGASREATFSVVLEPVLFLVIGALCLHGGTRTFYQALIPQLDNTAAFTMWIAAIVAMVIVVQVEAARMPIDDPTTHLELTMVHEVQILDHSGPELAMLQLGAAIKLFVGVSAIAALVNPWAGSTLIVTASPLRGFNGIIVHLALCLGIAIAIGLSESVIARIKLRVIPQYVVIALIASAVALLAMLGRTGGHG